jgi:hypothetical protein
VTNDSVWLLHQQGGEVDSETGLLLSLHPWLPEALSMDTQAQVRLLGCWAEHGWGFSG